MFNRPERPLTRQLQNEAERRGLRPESAAMLSIEDAFALIRDMPYARASTHEPSGIIGEWRGTCSTKHELLRAVLAEAGLKSSMIACTQLVMVPPNADPELLTLTGGQSVVDVHNYLVVHAPEGDMRVDATWPLAAAAAGLPVNPEWVWGKDMTLACTPLESWVVPEEDSLAGFKDRLLNERYTPQELQRRDQFIEKVGELFLR